jgi:hypothetical protein
VARKAGATETFLQFAGAATGTLLVLYFFGGLVLWARYHAAGIPADQTVAIQPRELLVVVGLRTLVVEILVFGAVASAASALAWRWNVRPAGRRLPPATGVDVSAIFVGALLVAAFVYVACWDSHPWVTNGGAAQVAGLAVAGVVAVSVLYGRWLNRRLGWSRKAPPLRSAVTLSMPIVAVSAATVGLAFEGAKAPILPAVKIIRTDPNGRVDGFFVGETSSEVLVGTGLCRLGEDKIVHVGVVPRTDIAAVVMTKSVRLTDESLRRSKAASLGIVCWPGRDP